MAEVRGHRGAHPQDRERFAAARHAVLRRAVADLSWLLERGYAEPSALKLVGDRYRLDARQRWAVRRSACSDTALRRREAHRRRDVAGQQLWIDGFNVLTTVETALGGGVVLVGRDSSWRDLAGVHGTWRRVAETAPAIAAIGECLERLGVASCRWLLDQPVSNSGRLRGWLLAAAAERGWSFQADLLPDPDRELLAAEAIVASADSRILDGCRAWFGLAGAVLEGRDGVCAVDLRGG